jgi:hypothetical protein
MMREIIGYKYEVLYDGHTIHEDDEVFDTEEEAREESEFYIQEKVDDWIIEDAWHPEEGMDDGKWFDVVIHEVYVYKS